MIRITLSSHANSFVFVSACLPISPPPAQSETKPLVQKVSKAKFREVGQTLRLSGLRHPALSRNAPSVASPELNPEDQTMSGQAWASRTAGHEVEGAKRRG